MNLRQLFDLSLTARAQETALEFYTEQGLRTLTFEEVNLRAKRMASVLEARGLRRGDRVCVHLANRIEILDVYLACVFLASSSCLSISFTKIAR